VIFDLDGTLVDSFAGIDAAVELARQHAAPRLAPRSVRDQIGPPLAQMLRRAFTEASEAEVDGMSGRFRSAYDDETIYLTTAYDGVTETLFRLRDLGVRCFIATNKPRRGRDIILRHLGLHAAFVDLVSPDDRAPPYPRKQDAVEALLHRHSLRAEQTAVVGDGEDDRRAARAHGLHFLFATWGYGHLGEDAVDVTRLPSMHDLLSMWAPLRDREHHA
jgi:phosphoglycolate phosphatase